MAEAAIYAHMASDGLAHCSYDVPFETIELLNNPTMVSTVEYVEFSFYEEDWSDALLNQLPEETGRKGDPPRVGTLTYEDGEVVSLEFKDPREYIDIEDWVEGVS